MHTVLDAIFDHVEKTHNPDCLHVAEGERQQPLPGQCHLGRLLRRLLKLHIFATLGRFESPPEPALRGETRVRHPGDHYQRSCECRPKAITYAGEVNMATQSDGGMQGGLEGYHRWKSVEEESQGPLLEKGSDTRQLGTRGGSAFQGPQSGEKSTLVCIYRALILFMC